MLHLQLLLLIIQTREFFYEYICKNTINFFIQPKKKKIEQNKKIGFNCKLSHLTDNVHILEHNTYVDLITSSAVNHKIHIR